MTESEQLNYVIQRMAEELSIDGLGDALDPIVAQAEKDREEQEEGVSEEL